MALTLLLFACATAMALAVLAVALSVRDVRTAAVVGVHRRLGLDHAPALELSLLPSQPAGALGAIDRFFLELVEQSGSHLTPATALSLVSGTGIVALVAALVLSESLLWSAAALSVGVVLPLAYWSIHRLRRRRQLQKALPEAMEMLADGVRSGRNLEQSIQLVARQLRGPLADEFAYCGSQLALGQSAVAVLDRMTRRVPFAEFKILAIAVLVHRQTGGNLALLVERLAAATRERQDFHGHLRSITSGSKLSALGLLAGTLAAVGLLAWMDPAYVQTFFTHPWGLSLLITAGALQLVGLVWVWFIVRIDY